MFYFQGDKVKLSQSKLCSWVRGLQPFGTCRTDCRGIVMEVGALAKILDVGWAAALALREGRKLRGRSRGSSMPRCPSDWEPTVITFYCVLSGFDRPIVAILV